MRLSLGRIRQHELMSYFFALLMPLLLAGLVQFNNQLYFDKNFGYDMPQHLNNTISILTTGQMPPPPLTPSTYEAFQAPLFYYLSALIIRIGDMLIVGDAYFVLMPWILYAVGMLWVIITGVFILRSFPQIPLFIRSLIISVIALFPCNTMMSVMYSNDLPVTLFSALAVWSLWLMCRRNQLTSRRQWLQTALFAGIATLFKLSGLITVGIYVSLAMYVVLQLLWRRQTDKARQVIIASSIGLPLMLAPWAINNQHTQQYVRNEFGVIGEPKRLWDVVTPSFFVSFDFDIFDSPFAFETGSSSFWTLQYLTLHNDYYNHWYSRAYRYYPSDRLFTITSQKPILDRKPIPYTRLIDAITLQFLALPITGVMILGVCVSLYRVLFRNRFALRDGSVLVLLYVVIAEGAQLLRFISYPDIYAVIIHARHLGFLYGFTFIIGAWWLMRLTRQHKHGKLISFIFATVMLAYCLIAIRLMWLPPI